MSFEEWMEQVVHGFEVVGVVILVLGSGMALGRFLVAVGRGDPAYRQVRHDIGRAILLGLEVLIIADIVLTITVEASVETALTLGLIVLVRTFLSFSLEIELDGALPWHRARRGQNRPQEQPGGDSSGAGDEVIPTG